MSSLDLERLLRLADADIGPPPPLPADLALRALRRADARRRRSLLVSGVAAAILLTVAILPPRRITDARRPPVAEPGPETAVAPQSTSDWRAEIVALRAQADAHLATARRMAELRRWRHEEQKLRAALAAMRAERRRDDPIRLAHAARDQAAALLVQQAGRMQHGLHQPAPAMRGYREAIRLFPDSPWATVAREKLNELSREEGETL